MYLLLEVSVYKSFPNPVNPVRGVCEMVPVSCFCFWVFFLHRWGNQHFKRSLVMGLMTLGTDAEQLQSREIPMQIPHPGTHKENPPNPVTSETVLEPISRR